VIFLCKSTISYMINQNYKILKKKLNEFKRLYYLNLLLKGLFIVGGSFFLLTLILSILEYVGYFNTVVRTILYFGFLLANLALLTVYVLNPLRGILKLGKIIDDETIGAILGKHFRVEVKDKIKNAIQLDRMLNEEDYERELLIACIEQKSKDLIEIPFKKAIDLRENKKYLFPALAIMVLFLSGWYLVPDAIQNPAKRIINFNTEYSRPAPFDIEILNEFPLRGFKNERYILEIKTVGEVLPTEVKLKYGGAKIKMQGKERNTFFYEFRNLDESLNFKIEANGFLFGPYELKTISKATIKDIVLFVDYPDHTGIENEKIVNISDITVPEGSILKWNIYTDFAERLIIKRNIGENELDRRGQSFEFEKKITEDETISFLALGSDELLGDSITFVVSVIADQFPQIQVEEFQDSVYLSRIYFQGLIRDDYGFKELKTVYVIERGNEQEILNIPIEIEDNVLNQNFYHWIDLNNIGLSPGEQIQVYFEVTDNDMINEYKRSVSNYFYFRIPGINEIITERIESDKVIRSSVSRSMNDLNNLQNEIDNLRREMISSENVSWDQRERLKDLLEKQKTLMEEHELLNRLSQETNLKDQQFRQVNDEIIQKQDELQNLINEVLTDEMKELYKKIQEELDKLDRNEVFQMLEKMQFELKRF
jgi:hypothetical protein